MKGLCRNKEVAAKYNLPISFGCDIIGDVDQLIILIEITYKEKLTYEFVERKYIE